MAESKHGVIVVTSTTGNGDAPENASRFMRFVKKKATSETMPFQNCSFAVLGLGDTNYDNFCQVARIADKKLGELGGVRVRPPAFADEAVGLEETVEPWISSILLDVAKACAPNLTENGSKGNGETNGEVSTTRDSTTLSASSSSTEVSRGVAAVKSLIGLPEPTSSFPTNHQMRIDPLPLSRTCEVCDGDPKEETNSQHFHHISTQSQSTVSSSGFHYTFRKPFLSTILKARYLTQTSLKAANEVSAIFARDDVFDAKLMDASSVLSRSFPPTADSENDMSQSGKRVIELTLSLPDDFTLEYSPGDSVGLLIENKPEDVRFVLDMLIKHQGIRSDQDVSIDSGTPLTVEYAVRSLFDLSSPIKNKRLIQSLAHYAVNEEEARVLGFLSSKHGDKIFQKYVTNQSLSVIDILREFPSAQGISLSTLLGMLPTTVPRYYSISSSPLEHQKLSLTISLSVVDYISESLVVYGNEHGFRRCRGVATSYLEAVCAPLIIDPKSPGYMPPKLRIFPKPTTDFRMPNTLATPLVLIGPGTGVAPFIGFLSHRKALISSIESTAAASTVVEGTWRGGYEVDESELKIHEQHDSSGLKAGAEFRSHQQPGSVDLYFGCRSPDHDWIYREEMNAFKDDGTLSGLYTAFSRSERKQYVQDIMKSDECASRLAGLILKDGATVYVCGDGNKMAKDVVRALTEIISSHLPGGEQDATQYVERMKRRNKLLLDIWS